MCGVASSEIRRHRLTVEDYHRLGEAGILSEDARVDLIEGDLVDRAPIGSRHAATVSVLNDVFRVTLHGRAIVAVQSPVALSDHSEPQPDLAILKFRENHYRAAHPKPADVLWLIEVADTPAQPMTGGSRWNSMPATVSQRFGLVDPPGYHAARGLPRPRGGEYRHVDSYRCGTVSPKAFSDLSVSLRALGFAGG